MALYSAAELNRKDDHIILSNKPNISYSVLDIVFSLVCVVAESTSYEHSTVKLNTLEPLKSCLRSFEMWQ